MAKKIVFMGTPMFAVPILKSLYQNGYPISDVYTQPPQKSQRGQKINKSPIQGIAETLNLDFRTPKNLKDISIKPLETIYIEIPFDEQVKLNSEIAESLSFKQSNERDDLNIKGEIRENLQNTINIKINLKGNGLDHIQYKNKESIKIELENSLYQDMSEFSLNKDMKIIEVLHSSDLVSSKSEARRLLNQGAIRIEGEKVSDMDMILSNGTEYIIKVGKRRFLKVK